MLIFSIKLNQDEKTFLNSIKTLKKRLKANLNLFKKKTVIESFFNLFNKVFCLYTKLFS